MPVISLKTVIPSPLQLGIQFVGWWAVATGLQLLWQPEAGLAAAVSLAVCPAVLYTTLYSTIFSLQLWSLSLVWLAMPVLIFSATWLRWYWALGLTVLLAGALWRVISLECKDLPTERASAGSPFAWGSVLILFWVAVTGAGGYGFQTTDYVLHNGRLEDLVRYAWPVVYPDPPLSNGDPSSAERRMLVTYSAYYLPAALLGKFCGLAIAREAMHYWTLAGCWLALRWLVSLSGLRSTLLAAGLFMLFGGWDFVGAALHLVSTPPFGSLHSMEWLTVLGSFRHSPGWLDSWAWYVLSEDYFGNWVSMTVSLLWAPHQSIAAWLAAALLLRTAQQQRWMAVGMIYALLSLWSPMALLGLFPLAIFLVWQSASLRVWFSWPNLVAAFFLLLMAGYYGSASALSNPSGLLQLKDGWLTLPWLLVFHLLAWGIYALAVQWVAVPADAGSRAIWKGLLWILFLLPFVHYGTFNDLLVRCSAPVYFLLLVFLLRAVRICWNDGRTQHAVVLVLLLLPGTASGVYNLGHAITHLDVKVAGQSVIRFGGGWQFLGSTESLFARMFAAPLPVSQAAVEESPP